MADLALYFFFHITPLVVLLAIPLYFIVRPLIWGFEKIKEHLE